MSVTPSIYLNTDMINGYAVYGQSTKTTMLNDLKNNGITVHARNAVSNIISGFYKE